MLENLNHVVGVISAGEIQNLVEINFFSANKTTLVTPLSVNKSIVFPGVDAYHGTGPKGNTRYILKQKRHLLVLLSAIIRRSL